jgi:FkbM family methyltransferase
MRVLGLGRSLLVRVLAVAGAHRLLLRWRAWESAHHNEPEIQILRYLVDPGRTAIDVGAAEGIYAYCLQRLARHCIAFEPNPDSLAALKRALPTVETYNAAVSAQEGYTSLRVPVVNGIRYSGWGTIEPNNRFAELPAHVVSETTVRTICPDRMGFDDVGFVKIDVEGHELEVLAGLYGILAKCRPNILIEIGDDRRGGCLSEVRRRLEVLGYIGLRLEGGVMRSLAQEEVVNGSINVIFIPGPRAPQVPIFGSST